MRSRVQIIFGAALLAASSCAADYCRDVVEPTLAGVFASWTRYMPDADAVAAVCTNVDWRIVRKRRSRQREVWIGGTAPEGENPLP